MENVDNQLVLVTKHTFRLSSNLPRPVAEDLERRLRSNPHAEVTDSNDAWAVLQSFETAEYRQTSKYALCVGVPFVEQYLADRTVVDRLQDKSVFCLLLEPECEIVFSEQISKTEVTTLSKKVRWMGGTVGTKVSDTSIVIASCASVTATSVYQQAVRSNIPIAMPSWIEQLWNSRVEQPSTPLLPLQGLRVNGEVSHDELKRTGAQIDELEYCHVAIALTSSDDIVARASSMNIPVVGTQWLVDSIAARRALAIADYPVPENLPLLVSEDSYLDGLVIDITLLPSLMQPAARVEINNGGGMWSMAGQLHEELQLLNVVLIDAGADGDNKYVCPKSAEWLKGSLTRGCTCLKRDWLSACTTNAQCVPMKRYKADVQFAGVENPRLLGNLKSELSQLGNTQSSMPAIEDTRTRPKQELQAQTSSAPESNMIFNGYVIAVCGKEIPQFDEIESEVAARGGKLVKGPAIGKERRLDYVVIADGQKPSDCKELEKRDRSQLYKRNVTSAMWLFESLRLNKLLKVPNPLQPNLQPSRVPLEKLKTVFAKYTFHLSNWKDNSYIDSKTVMVLPDEKGVNKLCKILGASVCKHRQWHRVTHYIVMSPEVSMNDKYKEALARDLPILHYTWVCESFRKGYEVPADQYKVNFEKGHVEQNVDFYARIPVSKEEPPTEIAPSCASVPSVVDIGGVLQNYVIVFTMPALSADTNIVSIAQDLGATVDLHGKSPRNPDNTYVLICMEDEVIDADGATATVPWLHACMSKKCVVPLDTFAPRSGPATGGVRLAVDSGRHRRLKRATAEKSKKVKEILASAEKKLRK